MRPLNEIKELFQSYGNVMRTKELRASKVYYEDIQQLIQDGVIEKIKQGCYYMPDSENFSEVHLIRALFPDAVLCMDTALFYYRYSDRTPGAWHLAVDKDVSRYRVKLDYPFVQAYFLEPHTLTLGAADGEIDETPVRIYDRDRAICDCLRYMGRMDKETFNKAIQGYVNDPKKNVTRLLEYSKTLRVQQKVYDLIGVWL